MKRQLATSYIKHLAVSVLSNVSARLKSTCNLTGQCFEMPNVSYTQPLWASLRNILQLFTDKKTNND